MFWDTYLDLILADHEQHSEALEFFVRDNVAFAGFLDRECWHVDL
jgi:hypothetical protein